MVHLPPFASPRLHFLGGIGLATLWLLFATAHVMTFNATGRLSLLLFGVAETVIALFFVFRTQPKSAATHPGEWAVAVAGTFLVLLVRPTDDSPPVIAEWGLMLGSALQIAGVLSLNRSFAIVPALRELKTGGMYAVVRHPIYMSYVISFSCYGAANFSLWNLLVLAFSLGLLLVRVHFEEMHLSQTPEYRAYRSRVRWRLLPFVY